MRGIVNMFVSNTQDTSFGHLDNARMAARDPSIGERIKKARLRAQLTPTDLARLIGVKPQAIYMLESGGVNAPTPSNLFKIADALGVSARMLVFGEAVRSGGTGRAPEPESQYSVEQVFDEETLLFARRFQTLDEGQRRQWMLSLLLTFHPRTPHESQAAPVVLKAVPHKKKP